MCIKLCPVSSNECSLGQVPQECQGKYKKYKPCKCIYKEEKCNGPFEKMFTIVMNFCMRTEEFDDAHDEVSDLACANRDNSDSERCDIPEFPFCVSGKRNVPPSTVNGTEEETKSNKGQAAVGLPGTSKFWNIECRDVRSVSWEGI